MSMCMCMCMQCWELLLNKVIYYYYKLLFNKSNILLLQVTFQ